MASSKVKFLWSMALLLLVVSAEENQSLPSGDAGDTAPNNAGSSTDLHVVVLVDKETESKGLENQLLHSACRLGYTNVGVIRDWCPSGKCEEDVRLESHLKGLAKDNWAIIINPGNEFVYLMGLPEKASQKLSEINEGIIIAEQPVTSDETEKEEDERDDKESNGSESVETNEIKRRAKEGGEKDEKHVESEDGRGEKEERNPLSVALRGGGTILGRVGTILQALSEGKAPRDVMFDTSAQLVLYGNRQKGGLAMGVPIETKFTPEDGQEEDATSPFVIYSLEDKLDFYNLVEVGGEGPQYCPFTGDQPIAKDEQPPRLLLSLDVSGAWVPFLEEILQCVARQNYSKGRIDVWIHTKSGMQEREIEQFKENGTDYSSIVVVKDESVDLASISSKCAELSCDYAVVMDPHVLLEDAATLSSLVSAGRPVVGPLLSEAKWKGAKSNFVLSSDGASQWQELIQQRTARGTLRVTEMRNLVMYRKDALQTIENGGKPMHYINNDRRRGYLLDHRGGYKEGRLHPDLWGMRHNRFMWIRRYIHPEVLQVIRKEKKPEELGPYLYYIPFYTERYCREMIEEMENHGKWFEKDVDDREEAAHQYSSRNINFEEIDYASDYHIILESIHKELLAALYGGYRAASEASLIFVLKYSSSERYGTFTYHLDGATYTFNIALNSNFTGGGIQYKMGNRYFDDEEEFLVPHNRTGWAVIQPNRPLHVHRGVALEAGTRYAMINIINTNDENSKGGPNEFEL